MISQTQSARSPSDKNMPDLSNSIQANLNSNTSPRRLKHNLRSIDLSKLKLSLPKSTINNDPPTKVFRGSLTSRKTDRTEAFIFSKRVTENPDNSSSVVHSARVSKKIRLKPLLPKFNNDVPAISKESLSPSVKKDEKTQSKMRFRSSKSEKCLTVNQESDNLTTQKQPSTRENTNQNSDRASHFSGRLPSIELRTAEDISKKPDFEEVKMHTYGIQKTKVSKITNHYVPKEFNNKALTPSNEIKKKKVVEKKAIMHFGGGLAIKADYGWLGPFEENTERLKTPLSFRGNLKIVESHMTKNKERSNMSSSESVRAKSTEKPRITINNIDHLPVIKIPLEDQQKIASEENFITRNTFTETKRTKSLHYLGPAKFPSAETIELPSSAKKMRKKSSIDNQVNSAPTSQEGEQTPIGINLPSVGDASPYTPNKKSVTFTFTESSVASDSGSPANSDSHSTSSPLRSSFKKAALGGKVLKPSGFAGEIPSKRNDALDVEDSQDDSSTSSQNEENEVEEPEEKFTVFKSSLNNVNFFELNQDNLFINNRRYSSVNEIIKSSRSPNSPREDPAAPMIVSYQGDPNEIIVQPKYMETRGSMCFTEFWSEKSKRNYKKLRKEEDGAIKKLYTEAEDTLYRSERERKKSILQARMFANQNESSSPANTLQINHLAAFPKRLSCQIEPSSTSPRVRGVIDAPVKTPSAGPRKTSLFLALNH